MPKKKFSGKKLPPSELDKIYKKTKKNNLQTGNETIIHTFIGTQLCHNIQCKVVEFLGDKWCPEEEECKYVIQNGIEFDEYRILMDHDELPHFETVFDNDFVLNDLDDDEKIRNKEDVRDMVSYECMLRLWERYDEWVWNV